MGGLKISVQIEVVPGRVEVCVFQVQVAGVGVYAQGLLASPNWPQLAQCCFSPENTGALGGLREMIEYSSCALPPS